MEQIKVELHLLNKSMGRTYPNHMFVGCNNTLEGAKSSTELRAYKPLIIKEVGCPDSPDFLRVVLSDSAINIALFNNNSVVMEFRLYLDSDELFAEWHLARAYEALEDGVRATLGDSLLVEFGQISSALCFSYHEGVLTIV